MNNTIIHYPMSVTPMDWGTQCTGYLYKAIRRLRECCRQVEAEVVSNSRNKIHQTWERPFRDSLYKRDELSKCDIDHDFFLPEVELNNLAKFRALPSRHGKLPLLEERIPRFEDGRGLEGVEGARGGQRAK